LGSGSCFDTTLQRPNPHLYYKGRKEEGVINTIAD
jgi:hypothetical protein